MKDTVKRMKYTGRKYLSKVSPFLPNHKIILILPALTDNVLWARSRGGYFHILCLTESLYQPLEVASDYYHHFRMRKLRHQCKQRINNKLDVKLNSKALQS